jgi:hypothetical protein
MPMSEQELRQGLKCNVRRMKDNLSVSTLLPLSRHQRTVNDSAHSFAMHRLSERTEVRSKNNYLSIVIFDRMPG